MCFFFRVEDVGTIFLQNSSTDRPVGPAVEDHFHNFSEGLFTHPQLEKWASAAFQDHVQPTFLSSTCLSLSTWPPVQLQKNSSTNPPWGTLPSGPCHLDLIVCCIVSSRVGSFRRSVARTMSSSQSRIIPFQGSSLQCFLEASNAAFRLLHVELFNAVLVRRDLAETRPEVCAASLFPG